MQARYTAEDNLLLLDRLIANWEDETVEFKEASKDFDTDKIGQYVSALCNEANLAGMESAWMVFGVKNKTREVVGTEYRSDPKRLNSIKLQIQNGTGPGLALRSVRVLQHPDGRVVIFEIPAAPQGIPISWKGHYYARAGESLQPLSMDKIDAIRMQDSSYDWTARVVEDADVGDLSKEALAVARRTFAEKNAARITPEEIAGWNDEEFLKHVGLMTKHGLTRGALLLLGSPESAYLLNPLMAELTWRLVGQETAYEHFTIPFILSTTQLYSRIRNIKIRLLPPGQLIQREVEKYDQKSVLEALHNCIAHQDYNAHSRISVTEYPDRLEFVSVGSFFEGSPDDYAVQGHMPRQYRNTSLVLAMTQLGMIDHLGYGIERMNRSQASRYLPLPDYDLSDPAEVKLTIYGRVVDEAYTKLLMEDSDLPFEDILALDRVQKGRPIPDSTLKRLRRKKLVEGRVPNIRVSAEIATATGTKAEYIKARGETDEYCMALISDYLTKNETATRGELDEVVYPALSEMLSEEQKKNKVDNLLRKMRKGGEIEASRRGGASQWRLA